MRNSTTVPASSSSRRFEEAALASLADFNAQSLANTAYAYAALQLPGAKTVLPYVSAYLEDRMRECGATEIVMVLWSYARCGFDPGARAIASLEKAAARVVGSMEPDQLTQYLWANTTLRYRPSASFVAAAERAARRGCPAKYDTEATTLTLWAYATLGLAPDPKVLERFADELEYVEASEFKPQSLSLGFWSAAVLATQPRGDAVGDLPGEHRGRERVLRALATHLPTLAPDAISPEGLSAVFMATLALNAREQLVGDGLRDAAAPSWRDSRRPPAAWRRTKTETRPCRSSRETSLGRSATWGWRTSSKNPFAEG